MRTASQASGSAAINSTATLRQPDRQRSARGRHGSMSSEGYGTLAILKTPRGRRNHAENGIFSGL